MPNPGESREGGRTAESPDVPFTQTHLSTVEAQAETVS